MYGFFRLYKYYLHWRNIIVFKNENTLKYALNYLSGYNSTFSPSPKITKKNVFLPLSRVSRPLVMI